MNNPRLRAVQLGRAGDVPGGMTQVVNAYLAWNFAGVDTDLITSRTSGSRLAQASVALSAAAGILRLRRARKVTVLVVHLSQGGSFVREGSLMILARLLGIGTVAHLHGSRFAEYADARRRLVRLILLSANQIVALSGETVMKLSSLTDASKVHLLANAVPGATPAEQRANTIVFGGAVSQRKGADVLLKAWSKVPDHNGWRLLLAGPLGEGMRMDSLPPRVEYLGPLPHATLMRLLSSSRAVVLPSRDEALPMFLLEAMARGNCVVATPVGGIPELLEGSAGLLVPPGDVDRLAETLLKVTSDDEFVNKMGARALSRFANRYSAEAVYPRVESIWRAALQN